MKIELETDYFNPEKRKGTVGIPNILVDEWVLHVSGGLFKILWTVAVRQWRNNLKPAVVTLSQMQKGTGLSRRWICVTIQEGLKKGVLKRKAVEGGNSFAYWLDLDAKIGPKR